MQYADLHIHSTYSDGLFTPEQIVDLAKEKGIKCISITDHDTIASQYITKEKIANIEIIPGVEFSTEYDDMEIHVLGYFIDINNPILIKNINSIQEKRRERAEKILKKLKDINIDINIQDIKSNNNTSFGRGNIGSAIAEKGYAKNYKEAFLRYLDKGKIAYVKGEKLNYKHVLKIIRESGGISVLAHPGKIYRKMSLEQLVKDFKCAGLNGIEVYHASHSSIQRNAFYNLALKHKLIITGGSDFHYSTSKNCIIGNYGIDENLLYKFKKLSIYK